MRAAININPIDDRRDSGFEDLAPALRRLLGQRRGSTTLMAGSADDAWGDALAETLAVGDRVLTVRVGPASAAWAERGRERGLEIETLDAPPGEGVPVLALSRRLEADRDGAIKAVFVRYTEPGTGVRSSIAAVRDALDAADHAALLLVDATDALPAMPLRKEHWGVDVIIAAGGLLPENVVLRATSHRAPISAYHAGPSAANLRTLDQRLDAVFEEGLSAVHARYGRYAEAARRAVRAWGLTTLAMDPRFYSDSITVARLANTTDARDQIAVDHGSAEDDAALIARIDAAERRLREAGVPVAAGAGVGAAIGWLMDTGAMTSVHAVA